MADYGRPIVPQRPLQLILARNFVASIATPAFIIDGEGVIAFYNEPAGLVLGKRFEETGAMSPELWLTTFGPFGEDGSAQAFEDLPLTRAARAGRPAHARFCIRVGSGQQQRIEASALPVVGDDGFQGAIVVFWPQGEEDQA